MPNWCENFIEVYGEPERLKAFDNQFKARHISYGGAFFNILKSEVGNLDLTKYLEFKIVSCTNPFLDASDYCTVTLLETESTEEGYSFTNFVPMTKDDFLNGWYDWSINNWGTKWDITHKYVFVTLDYDTGYISYYFDTAWSPCVPVVEAMAKQYPDLEIIHTYDEPGGCFAGIYKYQEGRLVEKLKHDDTSPQGYRIFKQKHMEAEYYTCKNCGALLEPWDLDNGLKCPDCASCEIYDYDGEALLTLEALKQDRGEICL